jgi:cysteine desulfurase family protein
MDRSDGTPDLSTLAYLDNAATTYPKPRAVLQAMADEYAQVGVNPGRSGYDLCLVAGNILQDTRRELAHLFGGSDPSHLVFAYNASDALNTMIQGILRPGDHAIATTVEHNSVIRPLNHLARDHGCAVEFVPVGPDCRVEPAEVARRFRANTRLVVVNHGSNVVGTIQPVAEIGALCRARGIAFGVDAAQTAGVIPIDVEAMCIDVLAFTGHKSLLGPTGIGGLYVREGVDIRSTRWGGTGVKSAAPYHLEEFPYRLEVGTPNLLGVAGLHFAQAYLREHGIAAIYRHEMELFAALQSGLGAISGVRLVGTTSLEHRLPVLSFTIDGMDPADIGTILDVDFNIATRTGLQCAPLIHEQLGTAPRGTVRMSLGPTNTAEHVERAITAVREIAADVKK